MLAAIPQALLVLPEYRSAVFSFSLGPSYSSGLRPEGTSSAASCLKTRLLMRAVQSAVRPAVQKSQLLQ